MAEFWRVKPMCDMVITEATAVTVTVVLRVRKLS